MSRIEPFLSLDVFSLFKKTDAAVPTLPPLSFMEASATLRRHAPDASVPVLGNSEYLADGSWVLRDIDHTPIALVLRDRVELSATEGGQVHVTATPEPEAPSAVWSARVHLVAITVWECHCGAKFKKHGRHVGQVKRCRTCGGVGYLRDQPTE